MSSISTNVEPSFVESILDGEILVVCRDSLGTEQVKSLGGKKSLFSNEKWKVRYGSEDDLAAHLIALRDARVAMGGALSGWPPAAIFEALRAKGKISGKFIELIWAKTGVQVLSDR